MVTCRSLLAIVGLAALTACGGVSNGPNGGSNNPPPPTPDTISGTVTLKGAPLAGATVTDFMTNTNTVYQVATTDANGHYAFTGMQVTDNVRGDYQIYVNKTGYSFYPAGGEEPGPGARTTPDSTKGTGWLPQDYFSA